MTLEVELDYALINARLLQVLNPLQCALQLQNTASLSSVKQEFSIKQEFNEYTIKFLGWW